MRIPRNMLGFLSYIHEFSTPVSLNLEICYLDERLNDVDNQFVISLLNTAFSCLLKRYSKSNKNKTKEDENPLNEDFINECDDYETLKRELCVLEIVDCEMALGLYDNSDSESRIDFYENKLEELINLLTYDLIEYSFINIEQEMELLLSCFERYDEIRITKYFYDIENNRLWLTIEG